MNKDLVTLERIKLMHPLLVAPTQLVYDEICAALTGRALCRFAYTLRTDAEQHIFFMQGRNGHPGPIVTNADSGQSYHNYGLAFDVVLLIDKDGNGTYETASWDFNTDFDGDKTPEWKEVDTICKKHGFEGLYHQRGDRWDLPHFQNTLGYSIKQLQELRKTHTTGYLPLTVK